MIEERLRRCLFRWALAAGSILVTCLFAEAALRALGFASEGEHRLLRITNAPAPAVRARSLFLDAYPSNPRGYVDVDLRREGVAGHYESLGVRDVRRAARTHPHAIEFQYNSGGFRDAELGPRRPGVRRVAVVGDSFTEGQGVREADTYVRRLERLLDDLDPGGWEVLNFGWRALDFPELSRSVEQALQNDPDVLVFGMVLNDAERSPEYDRLWPELNDWIMTRPRVEPMSFFQLRLAAFVRGRVEFFRVDRDATRWYLDMYREPNREGWERTRARIRDVKRESGRRGVTLLLALWPLLVDLEGDYPFLSTHQTIGRFCRRIDVRFVDLLDVLRGRKTRDLWAHPIDHHPNEIAHGIAARALASEIRRAMEELSARER